MDYNYCSIYIFNNGSISLNINRITKVRSRQAVKLPAVQPVVMATGHWPAYEGV